ncbi:hypothetical protein Slin15195_G073220 [Septoria linicola]|uniref:Uncharacterized protein n=1 Tax=Septoria linicola TaxID=215465 RepID=A0A9Q9EM19_9PEZI|nr:hypothetical protein Slin15195_G073220 [Septoria linicola]
MSSCPRPPLNSSPTRFFNGTQTIPWPPASSQHEVPYHARTSSPVRDARADDHRATQRSMVFKHSMFQEAQVFPDNYDLPHPSDSDAPKTDEGEFFLMQHSEQPLTSVDIKTQFTYDPVDLIPAFHTADFNLQLADCHPPTSSTLPPTSPQHYEIMTSNAALKQRYPLEWQWLAAYDQPFGTNLCGDGHLADLVRMNIFVNDIEEREWLDLYLAGIPDELARSLYDFGVAFAAGWKYAMVDKA